mgnify:CR=1 FL=1
MANLYHISPKIGPAPCEADVGRCPYYLADPTKTFPHFTTMADAEAHHLTQMTKAYGLTSTLTRANLDDSTQRRIEFYTTLDSLPPDRQRVVRRRMKVMKNTKKAAKKTAIFAGKAMIATAGVALFSTAMATRFTATVLNKRAPKISSINYKKLLLTKYWMPKPLFSA